MILITVCLEFVYTIIIMPIDFTQQRIGFVIASRNRGVAISSTGV